jgi:hypothetical protein
LIFVKNIKRDDPEAAMVAEWISEDPVHNVNGLTIEDAFEPGSEVVLISDEAGPVMAVRFQKALRVAIQFKPESRIRIAKAGAEVTEFFKTIAPQVGCREVIVNPGGKSVRFAERLGFVKQLFWKIKT